MAEEGTAAGWRARGGARGGGSKLIRASKRVQLTNEPTPSLVPTSAATPHNPLSLSLLFCSRRFPYSTAIVFDGLGPSRTSRITAFGNKPQNRLGQLQGDETRHVKVSSVNLASRWTNRLTFARKPIRVVPLSAIFSRWSVKVPLRWHHGHDSEG